MSTREGKSPIRVIREAKGLSLRKAADRAGLEINHLSKVERGLASMSMARMLPLAKTLGVDPGWLAEELAKTENARRAAE